MARGGVRFLFATSCHTYTFFVLIGFSRILTFFASLQILADAMGLGKTVMTIALILARLGKGTPNDSYVDDA